MWGVGVDGVPAAARRRELYGPTRARPGLVCSCYCVRTATVADGGGGALPRADDADALVPALILRRAVLTLRCRGETAWGPHVRVGVG